MPSLRQETVEGVRTLTLDRPQARNAIDPELRDALLAAFEQAAGAGSVRAVVITGAGGTFCAGADLGAVAGMRSSSAELSALVDAVAAIPKPVIAAIEGVATGVGLALALACDWRVAAPDARLLYREGRLGMVPTHGGVGRLVKLVGLARAKEALLGGDDLDGTRALQLGLVSELAEDAQATAHARALKMLRRAPLSYAAVKRLAGLASDADLGSVLAAEAAAQAELLASADHREGLAAARERREPCFTGH